MDRVKGLSLPLPMHSADLIDKALLTLQKCGFNADMALKEMTRIRKPDFELRDWTMKEIEAFEEGIRFKKFKSVGRGSVTSPVVETTNNRLKSGEQETVLDHGSIILATEGNNGKFECAHCGTTTTSMWRRTPGEVDLQKEFPRVYCHECGNEWVRYVALPSLADSHHHQQRESSKKLKGKDTT
ncbi:hypothetical protein BGZ65_012548, partial [Modicella reniformis]